MESKTEAEPLREPSDDSLVDAARRGDVTAYEQLVVRYQDRMFNLALHMTGSFEEAEDVVQEVFLRAYGALGDFRGGSGFHTWIYRIAMNGCHSRHRRVVRRKNVEAGPSLDVRTPDGTLRFEPAAAGSDPSDDLRARERHDAVRAALDRLPDEWREAVILRDMEGLSYGEIAVALSITATAVRSRLHRAREQLARWLKDERLS